MELGNIPTAGTVPVETAAGLPLADPSLPETVTIPAFGQALALVAPKFAFIRSDRAWRMRHILQPALTAQTLARQGVALDVGAGFGDFALPFARAFPGWTVLAFEPDAASYDALVGNLARHGLGNVLALPVALGSLASDAPQDPAAVAARLAALAPGDAEAVRHLVEMLPRRIFSGHRVNYGFMQPGPANDAEFHRFEAPTLAAGLLAGLKPTLLKLFAPHAETTILQDLAEAPLDHILGEAWSHVPSRLIYDAAGRRQTWLPLAGTPLLSLRRAACPAEVAVEPHLDVVVAMYNQRPYIVECVEGALNGASSEVRVSVVDDGSTDGCGDLVAETFAHDSRVRLLRKPNGGCASARNFGRLNSKASHIAFVDADDVPGPGLFAGLLELARHTGAEIVQGGFEMLHDSGTGGRRIVASYEGAETIVQHATRHGFAGGSCYLLPAAWLMEGQPTIWRRVYRRDFLDNRKIWFPEHIRAFDDQIFQMLTLQAVQNVPCLDGVAYGYRQHPAQDIKQGDERNFYSLEMFRLMLKRGISEGWSDFRPLLRSYVNTVNWIGGKLRPDLTGPFLRGAAELWVYARKTLGDYPFQDLPDSLFQAPDFPHHARQIEEKLRPIGESYAWPYLDSFEMQVPMMKSFRR